MVLIAGVVHQPVSIYIYMILAMELVDKSLIDSKD